MCCSTCVKGYACIGWVFSTIIFSVLLCALFISIYVGLGGHFPTYNWETGANVVFASTFFTILGSVAIFIIIVHYSNKAIHYNIIVRWVLFGVTNVFLVLAIILLFTATFQTSYKITSMDIVNYCDDYRKSHNNEIPPAIHKIEAWSSFLQHDGVPLGCCGCHNFNDYVNVPNCDNSTLTESNYSLSLPVKFNAPKTCCKELASCGNQLLNQDYLNYDIQLFIHQLFNERAQAAADFEAVKELSKTLGTQFSDWISGDASTTGQPVVLGLGQLPPVPPPEISPISYRPRLDCDYPIKNSMKMQLGDWDNATIWNSPEDVDASGQIAKNRRRAGDNYINSVDTNVKTAVLGCGDWLQLMLEGSNFVRLAFIDKGIGAAFTILVAIHPIVVTLMAIFLIHAFMNAIWFNYYYIPTILFPREKPLPFFPQRSGTALPSTKPSNVSAPSAAPEMVQITPEPTTVEDAEALHQ